MSTNVAAPTETRTWVRNPPPRCRYWRSAPIKAAEYKRSEQTYQRTAGESWVFAGRDQTQQPLCLRAVPGVQGEPRLPMVSLRSGAPRPVPAR